MSKIEQLLALSEQDHASFDTFIYSVSDAIEEPATLLVDKPYIKKRELVAGYNVSYGYRLAAAKLQDGGEKVYAEVSIFTIFNFLGKAIIDDSDLLEEIKLSIMEKLQRNH